MSARAPIVTAMAATEKSQRRTSALPAFLAEHRAEILATCDSAELLDEISDLAVSADATGALAGRHAIARLAQGMDIAQVVNELSRLRRAILDILWREHPADCVDERRALNLAIDRAIEISVARYAEAREAKLRDLAHDRELTLAKLESLLTASPVGIAFLDENLRYVRINALAALNGKPVHDHIGRTVHDILPPEAARQADAMLRRVLTSGEPALNLEFTLSAAKPEHRQWVLASYFPVRSPSGAMWGVGGVVSDISEMKRTREELQLEKQRLQAIVDHAPAAIWIKDAAGRVVLANQQLAQALGHEHGAVIGKRSDELLPREFAAAHQEADRAVFEQHHSIEVEEVTPSPSGVRTFLSVKFPIPGDPPLMAGIATEITERKRMEQDLRDAVRMRDDLLAVVSHDLRNPLATVQLAATMLIGQQTTDESAKRPLEMIVRSCSRMERLIDDLLDTARIRAGRFELTLDRERVEDVVCDAVDMQASLANEKGIEIVRRYELGGLEILCERDRILQVFGNLIGNAIKFCNPGDTIVVSGKRAGAAIEVCVEDTGPGIPADAVPHLFEPYWSGREHATEGSGLGLFIVRGIVEAHGGLVWAGNRDGGGARFCFTLPLAPSPHS